MSPKKKHPEDTNGEIIPTPEEIEAMQVREEGHREEITAIIKVQTESRRIAREHLLAMPPGEEKQAYLQEFLRGSLPPDLPRDPANEVKLKAYLQSLKFTP